MWRAGSWAWGEPEGRLPARVHGPDLLPLVPQFFAVREPRLRVGLALRGREIFSTAGLRPLGLASSGRCRPNESFGPSMPTVRLVGARTSDGPARAQARKRPSGRWDVPLDHTARPVPPALRVTRASVGQDLRPPPIRTPQSGNAQRMPGVSSCCEDLSRCTPTGAADRISFSSGRRGGQQNPSGPRRWRPSARGRPRA